MNPNKQLNGDSRRFLKQEYKQSNQSSFCDYNEAFIGYDQIRRPHGLDNIIHLLRQSKTPIEEQHVLEGGFGTGAFLDRIRHYVQMIYGVEGSDEGYRQTLQKVSNARNVQLQIGNILHLPFQDNFFHAYMVNQVPHHLNHRSHFQAIDGFIREARRVLKPGGQLIINTCSQKQLDPDKGVYWHFKYIYPAAYSMKNRYIPVQELKRRLESLGFSDINCTIPPEKIFFQRYYEDPSIALEPEFRMGDSTYAFLSEVELEASNRRLGKAIEEGSVFEIINRTTTQAAEIGETVIVSARRN